MYRIQALIVLGIVSTAICAKLPSSVTRCSRSDPRMNHCLQMAAQKYLPEFSRGIPEWGVPPLEPLKIGSLEFNENGLSSHMNDLVLHGYGTTQIKSFSLDFKHNVGEIIYNNKEIDTKGNYKVNGTLIVFPIEGNGKYQMNLFNVDTNVTFYFDVVKSTKGKEYMKITSHEITYNVKDKATFHLTNLFNGNKMFSEKLLAYINENWKGIVSDVAPSAFKAVVGNLLSNVNIFLAKVPLDELLSD